MRAALALAGALAAALSVVLLTPEARADNTFELQPIFMTELDLRLHSNKDLEAYDGFDVDRLRLGARVSYTQWFAAAAQVELVGEKPTILDAKAVLKPSPEWELTFGAGRTPLFSSARDEPIWALPVPELSMVTRAFWPGYGAGIEVHRLPTPRLPIEGWARVGNTGGSVLGNANSNYAFDGRLDVALGRAVTRAPASRRVGLRFGSGLHAESAASELGISGTTADGFLFYQPATVAGPRYVTEAHLVAYAGPVKLTVEAALGKESRSESLTGNPDAPSVSLASVTSRGAFVELGWMIVGPHRRHGMWPVESPIGTWDWGGLELGVRAERLDLEQGARDVTPGGATSGEAALRWWVTSFVAASAAGYYTAYDTAPIIEPGRTKSWLGIFRVTVQVPEEIALRR
jgi:phosphate-selective porin OprO and OprP